jgi:hypothetical protein
MNTGHSGGTDQGGEMERTIGDFDLCGRPSSLHEREMQSLLMTLRSSQMGVIISNKTITYRFYQMYDFTSFPMT